MNDQARGQLEKEIEKGRRDLEFAQQDAQTEVTDLTNQLQAIPGESETRSSSRCASTKAS